jgi:hypothetical protein
MVNGDDRITVHFGVPGSGEAVLLQDGLAAPAGHVVASFRLLPGLIGHPLGCACCVPRGPAAEALARLFLARARNDVPWFTAVAVVASSDGEAAVRAALRADQVCAGRYRLDRR